jgi:hypothetical protein
MSLEIDLSPHPHLLSFSRSVALSLRYMGGALLCAALLQGPKRAERRAVHAEQRLQSREQRA